MSLSNPIEVVVIRDLALRPRAWPPPRDDPPDLSPQQERDQNDLLDLLHCPVRRSILRALATAGPGNVKGLSARTSIAQNTLSQHLGHLRTAGLVFSQRRGREIWYEVTEDRVRYQREGDAKFALTVSGRAGTEVTITIGGAASRY